MEYDTYAPTWVDAKFYVEGDRYIIVLDELVLDEEGNAILDKQGNPEFKRNILANLSQNCFDQLVIKEYLE